MGNTTTISRLSNALNSAKRRHDALLGRGCPVHNIKFLIKDGGDRKDESYRAWLQFVEDRKRPSYDSRSLYAYVRENCLK